MASNTVHASGNASQMQVRLVSADKRFDVDENLLSLPSNFGCEQLNNVVRTLLSADNIIEVADLQFDFAIDNELLRSTLEAYIDANNLSTESVVEIIYFQKEAPPLPVHTIFHNDWIKDLKTKGDLILAGSLDGTARIWNINGEEVSIFKGHDSYINGVDWIYKANDKALVVTASQDTTLRIWQWSIADKSVECLYECKGHTQAVNAVAMNQSLDKFCSVSVDRMVKIWSAEDIHISEDEQPKQKKIKRSADASKIMDKYPVMTLSGHTDRINTAIWPRKNEVVTAAWDHCIKIWDIAIGVEKSAINGTLVIKTISYSPFEDLLAAGSFDEGAIKLYDPRTAEGTVVKLALKSHKNVVSSITWSPTTKYHLLSGSYDCSVKVWDIRSNLAPLYSIDGHDDKVFTVDWSEPQYIVSGGADSKIQIYRREESKVS